MKESPLPPQSPGPALAQCHRLYFMEKRLVPWRPPCNSGIHCPDDAETWKPGERRRKSEQKELEISNP
jgi:hypothetical protein